MGMRALQLKLALAHSVMSDKKHEYARTLRLSLLLVFGKTGVWISLCFLRVVLYRKLLKNTTACHSAIFESEGLLRRRAYQP
jgi:hypothetical protein